jgi:1-acyl-sn-glycerol-3-phosphate acyltransferase
MLMLPRSILFSFLMIIYTIIFSLLAMLVKPLPFIFMSRNLRLYANFVVLSLKYTCGVKYEIQGQANIPAGPVIIFSKHQSTWEGYAMQTVFIKICFVAKRELFWIPFFGWALAAMKPIAINRGSGKQAIQQIVTQGKRRLAEGISIVIFPEGTRTVPTKPGKYKIGGAVLAAEAGYPVIPVAHNAGECWPRGGFLKKPGTIHVRIGPAIATQGRTADEILLDAKRWIEAQMPSISKQYVS